MDELHGTWMTTFSTKEKKNKNKPQKSDSKKNVSFQVSRY